MKKYLFIYKSEVMTNLQYVFNILVGFIGYLVHIFIFLYLWKYVYSDPNEVINGYTMNQMVWYVIVTEILWSVLSGRTLCKKISDDVKCGNIAYNINKPYSYIGYSLFGHLGSMTIKGVIYLMLGMIVGFIFLGGFPTLNIVSILIILVSMVLALVINCLFSIFIGLISFVIEDSAPFWWVYSKLLLIVGTIFPIEYFPSFIQPMLKLSPVYAVAYGPAKLFVDFNYKEALMVLIAQVVYLGVAFGICSLMYRKGVKKLNVNGG